jgi:hypothetical protein
LKPAAAVTDWRHSPAVWASLGGVAVTVLVFAGFLILRSHAPAKPAQASAAAAAAHVHSVSLPSTDAPAPVAPPKARVVDLLAHVDPVADAIEGVWKLENGQLYSDTSDWARIAIAYQPPVEYDFRIEFTRVAGDNCIAQIFTHKNPCTFVLFGWKNTISGFQQVGGLSADKNPTGVKGSSTENGKRHTSVVKVRKASIEAWLDGSLLTRHSTSGGDLGPRDWLIPSPLGLGSRNSPMAIHSVQLIEISGQGKWLR